MATNVDQVLVVKNASGVAVDVLDVGWNSRVLMNLTTSWPGISSAAGTIKRNATQIATLSYSNGQLVATWANNMAGVIPVTNGDTITVTITSPVSYTKTVTIKRTQPDWGNSVDLGYILKLLRDAGLQGRTVSELVQDGINKINASYASPVFGFSTNLALNMKRLKAFLKDDPNLLLIV